MKEVVSRCVQVTEIEEWIGHVQWFDPTSLFTSPRDSGAMIYRTDEGVVIPLGIHACYPESSLPGHSVFISLDCYCIEADAND